MINQHRQKERGQALVEFILVTPILVFMMLGIFDFGRVLFTYAQVSSSLRDGLRFAEVLGTGGTDPYLNCTAMRDAVDNVWFADVTDADIIITYLKNEPDLTPVVPNNTPVVANDCEATGNITADQINDGDLLHIKIDIVVEFIVFPSADLPLTFEGQRTIVRTFPIGAPVRDTDFDGLDDRWEFSYFADGGPPLTFNPDDATATDDPDGDGCNNGCEETRGSDPTVDDSNGDPENVITSEGGPLVFLAVPSPAINFAATPECGAGLGTLGDVSFSWDAPASTTYLTAKIFDAGADVVLANGTLTASELAAGSCTTCEATGAVATTTKSYYMVIFKTYSIDDDPQDGIIDSTVDVNSTFSVERAASCDAPPTPNLSALVRDGNCAIGIVDFLWVDMDPDPTRAEIREALTGSVDLANDPVVVSGTISDTSTNECDACDNIDPTQGITYYMVAYNGATPEVVGSPSTLENLATCGTPPGASSPVDTIRVTLRKSNNGCNFGANRYLGETVTIDTSPIPGGAGFPANGTTNALGEVDFSSLAAGDYSITVPASVTDGAQTRNLEGNLVGGTCTDPSPTSVIIAISSGQHIPITFGYK